MSVVRVLRERLRRYRPRLERYMFGLSMLGLLDVAHLFIQQHRAFEGGCLGLATLGAGASPFNCAAVTAGPGSEFLGVSNMTWGFGFYLSVGLLTVLIFWAEPHIRMWMQGGRVGALLGGFSYSAYLTYLQVGPLEALCLLCLGSALIVTCLLGVQVAALVSSASSTPDSMSPRFVKRQIAVFVYFLAAAVVLVGADLVYFDATGALSPSEASSASVDPVPPAQCELETSKSPVDNQGRSLINFQDITKGSGDAGVTVIEYFDPNCPHCKDFHQVMKQLVANHSEDVRFVYKPFPLRRSSLPEIQALYVAAQSGKFTEMLEGQYARQNRSGISMSDLQSIATEIDMDPEVLSNRIEQNEYRDQVLQQRKRAVKIGVDSTPTVLVNGHFVASRTQECMNTFIEQAKSGTLGASGSE